MDEWQPCNLQSIDLKSYYTERTEQFVGEISELRISDDALSVEEIEDMRETWRKVMSSSQAEPGFYTVSVGGQQMGQVNSVRVGTQVQGHAGSWAGGWTYGEPEPPTLADYSSYQNIQRANGYLRQAKDILKAKGKVVNTELDVKLLDMLYQSDHPITHAAANKIADQQKQIELLMGLLAEQAQLVRQVEDSIPERVSQATQGYKLRMQAMAKEVEQLNGKALKRERQKENREAWERNRTGKRKR